MKYFIAIVGGVFGLVHVALAAYTPTAVDQQLVSAFSSKITAMHQVNPTKVQAIAPKLKVVVGLYMDETREHYVLNGLYLHIMMLLDNAMMAPAAVTMPAPVVAMPAPVVAPAPVAAPTPVTSAPVAASTVSSGQAYSQELANLIANSYKKGNPNAGFSILEFGDFQCAFCQRYTLAGTANALVEAYNGNVNVIYTHRVNPKHPLSQKAAEAAECVGVQGGSIPYYQFKEEMFLGTPSRTRIDETFDYINTGTMDKATFTSCLDSGAMADKVRSSNELAMSLSINSTPTHVFYKNSTGEYKIFEGGISLESWQEQIAQLEPSL